ncbi:cobyric acid synthase [Lampropedia puyangensis]|uniref:Cobyric acid synthase n=2 Tax=Lampropedia puyangensis TaxID=1330072 RepID=A0A4S8FGG1_9BURK|nr:cobyric acid synthase [Lampropedia puyangensis]
MVLGTTSGAGKSWLATALCAWYRAQGYRVAPFKAQNMSNNARVVATADGGYGEIGSAQYFQALAAGAVPDVRMNPLLLKPEADTHSQVVLLGQVDAALTQMPWRARSQHVWPVIAGALDALRQEVDVVVIEGAGSPAEINLSGSDVVNMRVARHCGAHALLVSDIDRGGAFAHLYGTWALLAPEDQRLIKGFVLNKFRGDASLLAPAPEMLQKMTGVPVVATIPMVRNHGLPEEDGVFDDRSVVGAPVAGQALRTIAIVAYPRISNLDEFQTLKNVPGVRLVWARDCRDVDDVDWIVLPGSKATGSDLRWLRSQGLDRAICAHAQAGKPVLGICGGLQMLGESLIDPADVQGNQPGLGLLPLVTVFEEHKTVRYGEHQFAPLKGAWNALSDVAFHAYEIHQGQTRTYVAMAEAEGGVQTAIANLAWANAKGNVLGCYLHGMFESDAVMYALWGGRSTSLHSVFAHMRDGVSQWFE